MTMARYPQQAMHFTLVLYAALAGAVNAVDALSLPSAAARSIDPNFLAHGFEVASFVPFVVDSDGNVNQFSANLIQGITNRTGGRAIIRLGGTSADYGFYEPGQSEPALPVATAETDDNVGATTLGPSFWQLTKLFPDASYMIQVPLATTNASETVAWVQSAIDNMNADQIFVFEIGNEPDWYSATYSGTTGVLGPPDWQAQFTNETYVGNWTERADAIVAGVTNLPAQPIFQAFDTAAHVAAQSSALEYLMSYNVCFPLGINDKGYIKTAAQHYYQNSAGTAATLATGLMNLTFTHERMDYLSQRIAYLEENQPDVPFILSEVGNSLGANLQYQAVLGSALWQVDFYLYAMSLGVQRVHYQQMYASAYKPRMWMPAAGTAAADQPQVYSNYYAPLLVGDFIGSTGSAGVARLDASQYGADVSAYAAFEGGEVQRVAVVNMEYWNLTSSTGARPSAAVQLTVPDGVDTVTVDHLSSPYGAGADATTITYGGSQWTYESLGFEVTGVRDDSQTVTVVDGVASFAVNASSAVLVSLIYS
ncbi:hypothetical protein BX600DRAFT_461192 [Xylariales sp. PMI_506]|nr:hypothetical protein BX600DRAFT_461192 [Xylariales sp. PMI_506]